jgi:hypothetical protein
MSRGFDHPDDDARRPLDDAALDALWHQVEQTSADNLRDAEAFTARVLARWETEKRSSVLARLRPRHAVAAACAMAAMLALVIGLMPNANPPVTSQPTTSLAQTSALGTLVEQAQHRYDQQAMLIGNVLTRTSEWVSTGNVVDWLVEPATWPGVE